MQGTLARIAIAALDSWVISIEVDIEDHMHKGTYDESLPPCTNWGIRGEDDRTQAERDGGIQPLEGVDEFFSLIAGDGQYISCPQSASLHSCNHENTPCDCHIQYTHLVPSSVVHLSYVPHLAAYLRQLLTKLLQGLIIILQSMRDVGNRRERRVCAFLRVLFPS